MEHSTPCACVPDGWFVVNPSHMAELKAASAALERVKELRDEWRAQRYGELFLTECADQIDDAIGDAL